MRTATAIFGSCALVIAITAFGDANPDAIRARVHVVRAVEPGSVEVYVSVPPAAANRAYTVTARCAGDEVESSYRPLDGDRSHGPFAPVTWKNLAGCNYAISAQLLGAGDRPIAHPSGRRASP